MVEAGYTARPAAPADAAAERRSEDRFRALFDMSRDGIVFVDLEGHIEEVNQAYLDLVGYDRGEITKHTYQDLTPEKWRAGEAAIIESQVMRRGFSDEYEKEYIRKDGSIAPIVLRTILVRDPDGRPVRFMGIVRDVTELKRAKEALERHARDLARSNEELEQFAYVASHDMQEPLRKIQAFGALLAEEKRTLLDDEGRRYIDFMTDAAARMQTLVSDLLSLSRVATGARVFEDIDLGGVLDTVLSDLSIGLKETSGRVEVGALPTVEADRTQMEQLFRNLVGNALKFRKPGAAPRVSVGPAEAVALLPGVPEPWRAVVVADDGIGFEPAQSESLFAPFKRLHARHEYEGAGIGLAICRKIVARHRGRITAAGVPDGGAAFTVTLPRRQPE